MKFCVLNKTKSFLFEFSADISFLFSIYLQQWVKKHTTFLYFRGNKGTLLHTLARKTKLSSYKRREKYNCHVCCGDFKAVLTNGNRKPFWGLERKHKHETYTLLRLCLIKFLSAHIPLILVDYRGRERHGWRPMWLLYKSRKLYCALSEIVSLV